MTRVLIPRDAVLEWSAYEEAGALVTGVRLAPEMFAEHLIFQIDVAGSDQRREAWGAYAEIADVGRYGVTGFAFTSESRRLDIEFAPGAFAAFDAITLSLPEGTPAAESLLVRMSEAFRTYPGC